MFKTIQELYTNMQEYTNALPKTPEEYKEIFLKVKNVFDTEHKNYEEMWAIYGKAATGNATVNEIARANQLSQQLVVSLRFPFLLAIPGTVFVLPVIVKMAKEFGIDIVPESVKKEFNI